MRYTDYALMNNMWLEMMKIQEITVQPHCSFFPNNDRDIVILKKFDKTVNAYCKVWRDKTNISLKKKISFLFNDHLRLFQL